MTIKTLSGKKAEVFFVESGRVVRAEVLPNRPVKYARYVVVVVERGPARIPKEEERYISEIHPTRLAALRADANSARAAFKKARRQRDVATKEYARLVNDREHELLRAMDAVNAERNRGR